MVTVNVQQLLTYLVLGALLILIIYLILLVKKLLSTTIPEANDVLVDTDKVLRDANVVSGIAADKATELDGAITAVTGVVTEIADDANNNQGLIKTATSMSKAAASAFSYIKDQKEEKEEKEFKEYKKAQKKEKKAEKKEKKAEKKAK